MRGIPDDIGQLRRGAGRLARIFAEFQAAGCGKIGHIIGVRNLVPGNGGPFRHDAAGETNQDYEADGEEETGGEGASGHKGPLIFDRMTAHTAAPARLLLPSV